MSLPLKVSGATSGLVAAYVCSRYKNTANTNADREKSGGLPVQLPSPSPALVSAPPTRQPLPPPFSTPAPVAISLDYDIDDDDDECLDDVNWQDQEVGLAHANVRAANHLQRPATEKGDWAKALELAKKKIFAHYHVAGAPGIVVAVAVDGKIVLNQAYGYRDIENYASHTAGSSVRIASISKSMTMTAVGKLLEEGKLDLDKPVREYVPNWPEKHPNITTRHLVSHLSGIRHYTKKCDIGKEDDPSSGSGNGECPEFRKRDPVKNTDEALNIFKEDELLSNPGEEFNYTTHGYTLLAAVVEAVSGEKFADRMGRMFQELGLSDTHLDWNEPIIPYRSRYYVRDPKTGLLKNAPYVDNSCKWAGGGIVSTTADLVKFGNAMLYSYQRIDDADAEVTKETKSKVKKVSSTKSDDKKASYLTHETMQQLWGPVIKMAKDPKSLSVSHYGMGWCVIPEEKTVGFGQERDFAAYHTGAATGASSVLLVVPTACEGGDAVDRRKGRVSGVVVSVLCNLEGVNHTKMALEVAELFKPLGARAQKSRVQFLEEKKTT